MGTLETILLILLIADALALGGLVLIQQSRGANIGAAFGSGSANTMFGSAGGGGTTFLVKLTVLLAVGFFIITFGLAYIANERASDLRGFDFTETEETESSNLTIPDIGVSTNEDSAQTEEGDALPDAGDSIPEPLSERTNDSDTTVATEDSNAATAPASDENE